MAISNKYSFYLKIFAPSILTIILFILAIFVIIIPRFEENIFERKKASIYDITSVAYGVLEECHQNYLNGKMSLEEAQESAAKTIEKMTYGPENMDYYWLQDKHPNMIMHPYRTELNGTDISSYQGPDGVYLFREFVRIVNESGEGYLQYIWQWYNDSSYIADKISFVKGFEPWEWIIGTGVYLEDFKNDMAMMKRNIINISILITVMITIILFTLVRQSMIIENKRRIAEEKITELNKELEARVERRTRKLNEVNKELESFSYSVSHDLRAPLRHIDGYLKMLYSKIDDPSRKMTDYYDKISTSIRHMSQMIDDLLRLSRLGRKQLSMSTVNMDELISEIITRFQPDINNVNIMWKVHPLPDIQGDVGLLRNAFENLISNAIKYSSKKDESIIEIGCMDHKDKIEIYIKDNGVGFDMKYSDKLFGIFQRLHSTEEFEGIGIGLAIVKQIINKHNGSIWADAKINKGATFFVSLPK